MNHDEIMYKYGHLFSPPPEWMTERHARILMVLRIGTSAHPEISGFRLPILVGSSTEMKKLIEEGLVLMWEEDICTDGTTIWMHPMYAVTTRGKQFLLVWETDRCKPQPKEEGQA